MTPLLLIIFILGYLLISTEQWHRIDKMITAILMMVLSWGLIFVFPDAIPQWLEPNSAELLLSKLGFVPDFVGTASEKVEMIQRTLGQHLSKTAEILVFLIGAMTLVELIDHFKGFQSIQGLFKSHKKWNLLVLLSGIAFFLSAVIDNLTATLVIITIYRKIIEDPMDRIWFASFIVIATNAGGAWSPIGDVTTTMLWIGHKVSSIPLILSTFVPSLLCIATPLFIARWLPAFKGEIAPKLAQDSNEGGTEIILGMCLFLAVPIVKSAFNIPPFMGMLLALSLFALYAEIKSKRAFSLTDLETGLTPQSPTMKSLQKVELPTVLFFLGILLTVAALESVGFIFNLGQGVQHSGLSTPLFMGILGIASAIIDNVPLVAGAMGMFSYPMDHETWHLLAYTAGTGGSILIIGSAAGVVAMGLEKISFVWYLKNIAPLALFGYLMGYILMIAI